MKYFVWLAMVACMSGCTVQPINEQPVIAKPEPEPIPINLTKIDLVAEETTFLNLIETIGSEDSQPALKRFYVMTDTHGIAWQGISFKAESEEGLLLQPSQTGGGIAVRIDDQAETRLPMAVNLELLRQVEVEQTTAEPDAAITFVRATLSGDTWSVTVSVDHPDTGWEDYTDGWQVETPDGEILTTRILLHPHVGERPFTRGSSAFTVPDDVTELHIRTHDLISGYALETVVVPIAAAGSGPLYEVFR